MKTHKDPENYAEMSKPFPDIESAQAALNAFDKAVYAARQKHRIGNVHVITEVTVAGDDGMEIGRTISHIGNFNRALPMTRVAARRVVDAYVARAEMLDEYVAEN